MKSSIISRPYFPTYFSHFASKAFRRFNKPSSKPESASQTLYWADEVYDYDGDLVLDRTGNPLVYYPWEVQLYLGGSPYVETAGAHPDYEPRQGKIDGNCFDISLDPLLVRGQVVDENGEPIVGATVKVKDGKGTVIHTDLDGCFSYWIANARTIEVSYPGYTPREIGADFGSPMKITLEIDENTSLPEFISCPQPTRKPLLKENSPANIQD